MVVAQRSRLLSAEEFERTAPEDLRSELIEGEVEVMSPAGFEHGAIAHRIAYRLEHHLRGNPGSGIVCAAETGFVLARDPDTVRAPDAAFVSSDRLPEGPSPTGFFEGAPDLAVEVVSPGDSSAAVETKVHDYLRHGTRLLWVVQPKTRTVTVYRSLRDVTVVTEDETLDGADVLPGLSVPVSELFEIG